MSILWCGGEDIDFPNGVGTKGVTIITSNFRSTYARSAVDSSGAITTIIQSQPFQGGAVTSCWLTFQMYPNTSSLNKSTIGVSLSGTTKGLYISTDSSTTGKVALSKYDGTTKTQLAAESGTSFSPVTALYRFDVQISNYGASATVNIYINQNLVLTFTGDVTVSGMTNFDSVGIIGSNVASTYWISEIIVSDVDTRPLVGLQTLALTGAGATTNWTNNTFSNINGTTISDTNPTSSDTNNQVQSYNVTDAVTGAYDVLMVKIAARSAKSATPTVNKIQLGYNNGSGSSASGTGASKSVTTTYTTYEQFDATNPITAAQWVKGDITALQLELTAKT